MTRRQEQLTEEEWAEMSSVRQQELLDAATSWEPFSADHIYDIATGEITRLLPTIWQRDDGAFLMYRGRTHVFLGETETCKTFVALEIMAQEIVKDCAVIFVDLEDAAITAVERLLQLGLSAEEIRDGFLYVNPHDGFDDKARVHLEYRIAQTGRQLTLVVIDSMTEAMALESLDPDKGLMVAAFYQNAPRWFAESLGGAVVIIDHVAKNPKNERFAIGSERKISGLTGAAYSFHKLDEFGRGMTGRVKIKVSKDRPGSVRPMASSKGKVLGTVMLVSDPDSGDIDVSFGAGSAIDMHEAALCDEEKANQLRRDIWAVVSVQPGIGATKLREAVNGDHAKKGFAIVWLLDHEYLRVETVGKERKHYVEQRLPDVMPSRVGPPPSEDDDDD